MQELVLLNPGKHRYRTKRPSSRLRMRRKRNTKPGYYPNVIRSGSMKRRRHHRHHYMMNYRNPIKKSRRHRRMSMSSGMSYASKPLSLLAPAAVGAAGALAVNALVNNLPLPDALKSGNTIYVTKLGLAALLGLFGNRIPGLSRYSGELARGSMIVTFTDLGKQVALASGINLSGTGYFGPGLIVNGPPIRNLPRISGAQGTQGTSLYVRGTGNTALYTR